jgi:hypothetical protein
MDKKVDFDDFLITPKPHTNIESRYSDVDPYYNGDKSPVRLPIMNAPMDGTVSLDNMATFWKSNIVVTLPRTIPYQKLHDMYDEPLDSGSNPFPDHTFISLGLEEMRHIIDNPDNYDYLIGEYFILDVANGHMQKVYETAQAFKEAFPTTKLMVGNIANPETYEWYARSGFVDFVRVGIGNGNMCLTTKQTSIGYPKASLIRECHQIKKELIHEYHHTYFHTDQGSLLKEKLATIPMIVADGGIKDYADIIKALAIGADYVMMGSIFNKALESSADNMLYGIKISPKFAKWFYEHNFPIKKKFYGMSTKIAQKKMGKKVLKTSEGVVRIQKVEYSLPKWVENFEHYLRSAMSYSNARNLKEFIGKANIILITENAFNRFNK